MPRTPKPWFWKARRAWYVTIDGARICLGPDKQEAVTRFHRMMAEPQQRRVASQSVAVLADTFLEWVQKHRAPDTYEWYRYRLERFVQMYPELLASDLRPYHVETWVDGYDFSRNSRRNYLRSVKRCLKWAKKQGYIDINPIEDMEVPSADHKEIVIAPEEFETMLSLVRNPYLEDLMITTWETGCRPQESLRVEARHIDLSNQRWIFPKSEAKMKKKARVIYLTDRAFEITRRLVAAHPQGPIFRNSNGKPWKTDAVNRACTALQVRMGKIEMAKRGLEIPEEEIAALIPTLHPTRTAKGVEIPKTPAELRCEAKRKLTDKLACSLVTRCSLYALRHSWATHALQKGVDPLTVAILMGHEDPSMLSKVYQHLSLNPTHMLEEARRAVG